jgi:hypothetical protein
MAAMNQAFTFLLSVSVCMISLSDAFIWQVNEELAPLQTLTFSER